MPEFLSAMLIGKQQTCIRILGAFCILLTAAPTWQDQGSDRWLLLCVPYWLMVGCLCATASGWLCGILYSTIRLQGGLRD